MAHKDKIIQEGGGEMRVKMWRMNGKEVPGGESEESRKAMGEAHRTGRGKGKGRMAVKTATVKI
jgi:hypothetical protein